MLSFVSSGLWQKCHMLPPTCYNLHIFIMHLRLAYASGIINVVEVIPRTSGSHFIIIFSHLHKYNSQQENSARESTIRTSCASLTMDARYAKPRGGPVVPTTALTALIVGGIREEFAFQPKISQPKISYFHFHLKG